MATCRENLPWEFAATSPARFSVAICRGFSLWKFAEVVRCVKKFFNIDVLFYN